MKIDALMQGNSVSIPIASDVLSRLNIGDVIKARIIEMSSKKLIMKLFDGTVFTAVLTHDIEAKPGDYLSLALKARINNQLVMEALNDDSVQALNENVLKRLADIGVKPDEKSLEILKELQIKDIPLTKELFQNIYNHVKNFKNLTPEKAIFLYTNKINFDSGNVESLNQLAGGKFKLGMEIEEISRMLENMIKEESPEQSMDKNVKPASLNNSIQLPDSLADNYNNASNSILSYSTDTAVKFEQITKILRQLSDYTDNIPALKEGLFKPLEDKSLWNAGENAHSEFLKLMKTFDGSDMEDLNRIKLLIEKALNSNAGNKIEDAEVTPQSLKTNEEIRISSDKDILKIQKELDRLFIDLRERDANNNNTSLKKLYKDILVKLTELREAMQSSRLPENLELMSRIDNIQSNIRFMDELYRSLIYIQIPVKLPDKNTTAELYILKKDLKRKKINAGNITMLIALKTDNMGTLETLVSLRGKNINLSIRAEEQKIIDFLKENYKILYESLENNGYKLSDIRYCINDEKINMLNVEEVVKKVTVGNTSVDYRV